MANYPYLVFSTDEVTRVAANTYTYANSRLIFATKASGAWATVVAELTAGATSRGYYNQTWIANHNDEFLIYSYNDQLWYSDDAGATWDEILGHDLYAYTIEMFYVGSQWVIVESDGSVWHSSDAHTWHYHSTSLAYADAYYGWQVALDANGALQMTYYTADGIIANAYSTDGGETWHERRLSTDDYYQPYLAVSGNYVIDLAIDSSVLWYRVSLDGGNRWYDPGTLTEVEMAVLYPSFGGLLDGSWGNFDYLSLKIVSGILYLFINIGCAVGAPQKFAQLIIKSSDWTSGAPTWELVGIYPEAVAVDAYVLGWSNTGDGVNGCLVFGGPMHYVPADDDWIAWREFREMSEDPADAGEVIYELTPSGASTTYHLTNNSTPVGSTWECVDEVAYVSVKWHDLPADPGPPVAWARIFVGRVDFERPTGDGIHVGHVRFA